MKDLKVGLVAGVIVIVTVPFLVLADLRPHESQEIVSFGNHTSEKPEVPELVEPGTEPAALHINTPTDVIFTCLVTGLKTPPQNLTLEAVDEPGNIIGRVGNLVDDGKDPDTTANDRIYTGLFRITATSFGNQYYRTRITYAGQTVVSPTHRLVVTEFPIGSAVSNPDKLVRDPFNEGMLYSDEVILWFVKGTSATRIKEIVSELGAEIVGTIPSLGLFQLRISGDGTASGVMAAIKILDRYPEVAHAQPSHHAAAEQN